MATVKRKKPPKIKTIMVLINNETNDLYACKSKVAIASVVKCHRNSLKEIINGMVIKAYTVKILNIL
jgi:hypothetical protein